MKPEGHDVWLSRWEAEEDARARRRRWLGPLRRAAGVSDLDSGQMRSYRPMPGWVESLRYRPPPLTERKCVNLYRFPEGLVVESTFFARIVRPHMDLPASWIDGNPTPEALGRAVREGLADSAFWTNGMSGPGPDERYPSGDPASHAPHSDLTVERLRRLSSRPKGKALWSAARYCMITQGQLWRDGPGVFMVKPTRNEGRGAFANLGRLYLTNTGASDFEAGCLVLTALAAAR